MFKSKDYVRLVRLPMSKIVNIPAKIENEHVVLRIKKPVSITDEETHINISVPIHNIMDQNIKHYKGRQVKLISKNEVLLVGINYRITSDEKTKYLDSIIENYNIRNIGRFKYEKLYFVEIIAQHELSLTFTGFKKAKLNNCQIKIPFLKENATSVNHAYSLISAHFEKHRKSHTGNVFKVVFAKHNNQGWNSLNYYRDVAIDENVSDNIDNSNPFFE